MAKLGINTGSAPNDGTGDSLIDGAIKVNTNFTEIYTAIGDGTTLAVPVTSVSAGTGINVSGSTGNVTITNTGIANTNNLRTDFLEVSGISTLSGGLTVTGNATATQFVGGGANITGISTLNIVNYSGGGGGGGSDTLADVTSRGATTNQTITFSASKGISMDTASNNPFQIYGSSNQKAYISHAQNNGGGGAGDLVVIAKNGLHVYGGTSETTANLGLEVTSGFSNLLYQGSSKLTTTNTGITVNGDINGTNLETGTGYLTLGNSSSAFDIRFSPSSGNSPAIRYDVSSGISIYNRYNGGADLLVDVTFGASQTFVKHITPFSDSTYNLGTNTNRWAAVWSDKFVGAGVTINNTGIDVTGHTETDTLSVSGISTFSGDINLNGANVVLALSGGSSDDRLKFHNSEIYQDTSSFKIISNTGGIVLRGGGTNAWSNASGAEDYIVATENGSVDLYYDNSKKLETTTSGVKITGESKSDSIALQGRSFSIQRAGAEDVLLTNTGTGGEIQIKAAGNVEIQSYQGSILLKTNTGASTSGGLSLYYATSQGAQIERLTTTSNGVDINGTTAVTGSLTVSNNITVGAAGSISGDASYAVSGKWDLGADGSNNYTFTGIGFPVTTNDPDLYLARGAVYEFVNGMGAHPFRIQSTANGSTGTQYNTGVTNNDVSNGTLKFEVPFNAPDTLYYQCTAHAAMGGKLYIYPTLR